jgi:parallel beta-helix repeat protein
VSGNGNNIDRENAKNNVIEVNTSVNSPGEGIRLDATSTGSTVRQNMMSGNHLFDVEDDSAGLLTAGTANIWTGNHEQ